MEEFTIDNYLLIQGFMIKELELKGNDLMIYAIIYNITQDGKTEFNESLEYIGSILGITRQSVMKTLHKLAADGLLEKKEYYENNVKKCSYKTLRCGKNGTKAFGAVENKEIEKKPIQIDEPVEHKEVDLFGNKTTYKTLKGKKIKEKKDLPVLFCDSDIKSLVNFETGNYTRLTELLFKAEGFSLSFAGIKEMSKIDYNYYLNAVENWATSKNLRRSNEGWLATIRQFMLNDKASGKLVYLPKPPTFLDVIDEFSANVDIDELLKKHNL